jgi:hypothetical protein
MNIPSPSSFDVYDKVSLTKVKDNTQPEGALPVSYNVEGFLLRKPTVGESILLFRTSRNGVHVPGIFTSSLVLDIKDNMIHTQNSVWELEYLKEAKAI